MASLSGVSISLNYLLVLVYGPAVNFREGSGGEDWELLFILCIFAFLLAWEEDEDSFSFECLESFEYASLLSF